MRLQNFIRGLLAEGMAIVGNAFDDGPLADAEHAKAELQRWHAQDALSLAFEAPAFSTQAAIWAASRVYRCCQAISRRDLPAEALQAELSPPFPGPLDPSAIYSADICLRSLPRLRDMASGLSPGDPLLACLDALGQSWPLSSVGMPLAVFEPDLQPFWSCRALRQLYVDRVMATRDMGRARQPAVREAIRSCIGAHEEFWPNFTRETCAPAVPGTGI